MKPSPSSPIEGALSSLSLSERPAQPSLEYCVSSFGVRFLVVSSNPSSFLASSSPSPSSSSSLPHPSIAEALRVVASWNLAAQPQASACGVVLADFEGENMGWGGTLECAQFLPSTLVSSSLSPVPSSTSPQLPQPPRLLGSTIASRSALASETSRTGLIVDARTAPGASIIAAVMENPLLVKLVWGAQNDNVSLRHQLLLHPSCIADVQLCYSDPGRRLGMKRALEKHPSLTELLGKLPPKDMDPGKYGAYARNERANPMPYGREMELVSASSADRWRLFVGLYSCVLFAIIY